MSLSISQENKNNLPISNEAKGGTSLTWDGANFSWDNADGTWSDPGIVISKENKNNLSVSNENKN